MKLLWSRFALADRERIFDYIEAESPRSAILVDEKIEAASDQLCIFPESGRPGRVAGTSELIVFGLPDILIYRVDAEVVCILRVLHGSQEWSDLKPFQGWG